VAVTDLTGESAIQFRGSKRSSTLSIAWTASKMADSLDGASPVFLRPAANSTDHFHPTKSPVCMTRYGTPLCFIGLLHKKVGSNYLSLASVLDQIVA
jgi:hypothetical protein